MILSCGARAFVLQASVNVFGRKFSSCLFLKNGRHRVECVKYSTSTRQCLSLTNMHACRGQAQRRLFLITSYHNRIQYNVCRLIHSSPALCDNSGFLKELDEKPEEDKYKTVKLVSYYVGIALFLSVSGVVFYEHLYWETPTYVFRQAGTKCLQCVEIRREFGEPLFAFGDPEMDLEWRNYKYEEYEKNGERYMSLELFLKGTKTGKAHAEVKKNKDKGWDFVLITARLDDEPEKVIIVEDHRSEMPLS